MELEKIDNILSETQELAKNIQSAFWALAERLVKIKGGELWKGVYASYDDFLEEIQVARSMDTKLRTVYLRFRGENEETIAQVGITKLYLIASRCEDERTAQKYLSTASQVGRADLMDAIAEDTHGEHEHKGDKVSFLICSTCSKWIRVRDG